MSKRLLFGGAIHESLECVPLTVRRKLDRAGLEISLAGWQQLSRAERMALCHLPVDSELELALYREMLLTSCGVVGVSLERLDDPNASARVRVVRATPEAIVERTREVGTSIADEVWCSLDEETRYALLKLTRLERNPLKIHALLVDLGLVLGPAPAKQAVLCEPRALAPSARVDEAAQHQ